MYDTSQPDWNWHHPDVPALFEDVISFWLDHGVAGLRVDVAHGIVKDPGLPAGTGFGFSQTVQGSSPAEPWLPQPADWGRYSVQSQLARYRRLARHVRLAG